MGTPTVDYLKLMIQINTMKNNVITTEDVNLDKNIKVQVLYKLKRKHKK